MRGIFFESRDPMTSVFCIVANQGTVYWRHQRNVETIPDLSIQGYAQSSYWRDQKLRTLRAPLLLPSLTASRLGPA